MSNIKNSNAEYTKIYSKVKETLPRYEDIRLGQPMNHGTSKPKP
jgi:hypothetical protein